jgi:hypothetical protein
MKIGKRRLLYGIALLAIVPTAVLAMTSTNYQILWDSVNSGGTDNSTSTNYLLRDTIGEHGTGFSESENYRIGAGYRVGDSQEPTLSITIGTQEDDEVSAWTAFSDGSNTVTLTATSSFSVDDYIGVIENQGFSQIIAVGKITNISGGVITVDDWEGEPGNLSATPAGSDDYAYRMNGSAATLGVQTTVSESTSMTLTDIATNANNGYTVSIQGVDNLTSGSSTIIAVSDGTVSVGSEEYGVETIGTLGVGTGSDLSIPTTTTRTVQESSTYGIDERVGIIYKLSISASTPSGNYEQTVLYRLTGNF